MPFVKKTPSEFEALSEYQKEKYLDEKSQHEAYIAKEQAEKSAKEAIEAMKVEFKTERDAELKALEDKNEAALQALADKHQIDIDEMKATLKRAKVGELDERIKGVSEFIVEKLSTEEGENLLKGFFKGRKLEMEVSEKAMLKPAGGVAPQFTTIVGPGHDDFHARDLIPVFPTISDVIKYIQFTVDPDAGYGYVAEGAQKPDLGYESTVEQSIVQKIAGLLDVTDEMLDDVVGFRSWIAYELPKAYLDFEDYQIYKGAGGQTAILGLWTQADFQTLPLGSVSQASNTIDKVMAGITEIRMLKRGTSGAVVSPVQWMEILINKGEGSGEYTYPIILRADGVMTIGGVPIYWSNVFEEEEGLVGDFARGAAIFQRKAMEIAYSSEHKDNFGKNIVTIRLEGRVALVIRFPEAFKRLFTSGS